MKPAFAGALLALFTLQACSPFAAALAASPAPFSKTDWAVAKVSCPLGCSDLTLNYLKSLVGTKVVLGSDRFDAAFVDPCVGSLRYEIQHRSALEAVVDMNLAVAPARRKLTPEALGLGAAQTVTSAVALCRGAQGEMSYQRMPVVEPDRVLVLFEEQSLVELR